MDNNLEKRLHNLNERLSYARDIFLGRHEEELSLLSNKLAELVEALRTSSLDDPFTAFSNIEELFNQVEAKLEESLTPMDKVRIVRHPQRICLRDILENVYDNFTEIGGQGEYSLDPGMLIARAVITRRRGKQVHSQQVLVIGQEKGHGEDFRNGGSIKPWGNAKAQQFMLVAETEGTPVHAYIFTPGSYPIEDYPGAAQQIARNIYCMAGLRVPVIAIISEGGSGGAEAIGLADKRLMLSHGYYSVISPEGASAIEGRNEPGTRASQELIEQCAKNLHITAQDNAEFGYIDQIIQEPALGARPHHFDFFRTLRQEVIRATDETVIQCRKWPILREIALAKLHRPSVNPENLFTRWKLSWQNQNTLVELRQKKFLQLGSNAAKDNRSFVDRNLVVVRDFVFNPLLHFKYFSAKFKRQARTFLAEAVNELDLFKSRLLQPLRNLFTDPNKPEVKEDLTSLSHWVEGHRHRTWNYLSPKFREDRSVSCPNSAVYGCPDLWGPDLFAEFAGVCSHCGHHFPMEPEWYVRNIFDKDSVIEFNSEIESGNPLNFPGFSEKIAKAQAQTGSKSGCMTFEASLENIHIVVAMLMGTFRGGSFGAAEGLKFVEAAKRAEKKHYPFLAYVHGTAGIRIQEGTHGVIQMPRCTVAVRRYIEAGGLYVVLYDTNSFAGPVASFLGCAPYQYAVRSSNIGFAGPQVILETTGTAVPPKYHRSYHALSRGHIQDIWDRRQIRANLHQVFLTTGGRNLYYR